MTAVEGNASVYQVYPVSCVTGERRAEFFEWRGGLGLNKRERGGGWRKRAGNSICARELQILRRDKSDGCGRIASVYHVYPVNCTISEESIH